MVMATSYMCVLTYIHTSVLASSSPLVCMCVHTYYTFLLNLLLFQLFFCYVHSGVHHKACFHYFLLQAWKAWGPQTRTTVSTTYCCTSYQTLHTDMYLCCPAVISLHEHAPIYSYSNMKVMFCAEGHIFRKHTRFGVNTSRTWWTEVCVQALSTTFSGATALLKWRLPASTPLLLILKVSHVLLHGSGSSHLTWNW